VSDPGSSGITRLLSGNGPHVFVVSSGLYVDSGNGECAVTEGDVLQFVGPLPPDATVARGVVLASKGQDCRKGTVVSIGLADLQEMQNHMHATIDQGLADLHAKQGQSGVPAAPPLAARPPVEAEFAAVAPPVDPNLEKDL